MKDGTGALAGLPVKISSGSAPRRAVVPAKMLERSERGNKRHSLVVAI
jgi:hypothetical protein